MPQPFRCIFCRYSFAMNDELLNANAQYQFLQDNQGNEFVHGREREGVRPNALCTEPERFNVGQHSVVSFFVGYKPGIRTRQRYDKGSRAISRNVEIDDHTKLAHIVLVPHLQAMAVQDKTSDDNIPARQALSAFQSVVRFASDDEGSLEIIHATDADVRRALDEWELTEYSYTVRPLNPIPGTALSRRRSDAYKREKIGRETGRVVPMDGETMRAQDGVIAETRDLAEDGYGQIGLKGQTPDGHTAQIPKLKFHMERAKNLKEREKPRYLRVQIDEPDDGAHFPTTIASAIMRFYR